MKLNLNYNICDLDGSEILENNLPINLGRGLARIFMQSNQTGDDLVKFLDWAKALHSDGIIDLDRADQKKFRTFIEDHPVLSLYVKNAIFESMDKKNNVPSE